VRKEKSLDHKQNVKKESPLKNASDNKIIYEDSNENI
jgi:hypothetical protein